MTMTQYNGIVLAIVPQTKKCSDLSVKSGDTTVGYHVRDIKNRRNAGVFTSESDALGSLRGAADGHFSINNHKGQWCEVEIRGGDRYIRSALMIDGSPAAFTNVDK